MEENQIRMTLLKPKRPGQVADISGTTFPTTLPIITSEQLIDESYPLAGNAAGQFPTNDQGLGGRWHRGYIPFVINANSGVTPVLGSWQTYTAAQGAVNLPLQLPAFGRVMWAIINFDSAITYSGSGSPVKIGIGTATNPSNILLSSTATAKNTQNVAIPSAGGSGTDNSTSNTPLTLQLAACATGGSAAGLWTGLIRGRLICEWVTMNKHP